MICSDLLLFKSFLFFSRCKPRLSAFFTKLAKSSGIVGANCASFSIFVIVFPVIGFTNGMECWSLRMVPMRLAVFPSFASLMTSASTSSGWYLHQFGVRLLTGRVECDFPFSCFGMCCHLNSV